ncbi:MAG: hypothetical protein R3E41_06900 [Burkholderiaceae bacterium]
MSQRRQPFLAARRRTLAAFATLPALPIATAMTTTAPDAAHDADAIVAPQPVLDLDRAAMDLFDAAEAGRWRDARDALSRARAATAALRSVEGAYTDAGGALHRYIEARNGLGADLLEAGTAVSVQDRRWLVSVASHVAARAGELSLPFVGHGNAVAPLIAALLYLALRMRRALVWQDDIGFHAAMGDFARLWTSLRGRLGARLAADRMHALEAALGRLTSHASAADVRRLYDSVIALRGG